MVQHPPSCLTTEEKFYFQKAEENVIDPKEQKEKKKWEPIIQSEVSQKEKHQYSILGHIYGIQKDRNENPECKAAKRDPDVLNSLLDSVGEGEGGMIWENGTETCK